MISFNYTEFNSFVNLPSKNTHYPKKWGLYEEIEALSDEIKGSVLI